MRESESGAVGVGAVAAAAAGNQDVDVFKKPIHPPPRKKKKVLDEETYVKEVEKIIERDFFPDLDGLRDRLDFLEARDSQDLVRLRQWYARQARTVAAASANASVLDSPATFETPQAGAAGNATPRLDDANAQPADDKSTQDPTDKDREKESKGGMSLDEFMSMHTSEDNESFENLMAETEAKFRRKYAWMFEAEEKHNQKYLPDLSLPAPPQPSLPAICPSVTNTTPLSTSTASVTASDTTTDTTFACDSSTESATAANSTTASLMAADSITASTIDLNSSTASTTASTTSTATTTAPASSATATAACTISATTTTPPATFTSVTNSTTAPYSGSTSKPGHVDNWKFHTFSSVMFVPDGITPSASKSIEDAKKKQRYIELANTRFHGNPFTETLSAAAMLEASAVQASKKEGKVGIDGKELGKETPRVNGYSFVTAPSPNPGVDASPLMTWGEVEGTPCQLDGSTTPLIRRHTPGPSYRIPQLPSRDRLGHKLAEVARQKHRDKKTRVLRATRHSLGTPSGRTSVGSERVVGMSPAAQRLLTARLGVKHTDAALRASYTPSPSARYPNFTPTPSARRHHTPTTPHPATPTPTTNTPSRVNTPKILAGRRAGTSEEGEGLGGLTDNLLDLPKRSGNSGTQQTTDNLLDLPKHSSINSNSSSDISESNKGISSGRKCAADFF